jgi:hypothetical protein
MAKETAFPTGLPLACWAQITFVPASYHRPPCPALQVEAGSYRNIALSLGVDSPEEVLFATDNILEAQAAAEAGWQVVLADRPGNKPLPAGHAFAVATSAKDFLAAFH